MIQMLRDILAIKHVRASWARMTDKYTPDKCKAAFVDAMNRKSHEWGMNHTRWINPSGLGEDGVYSLTTARDLAKMGVYAFQYQELRKMWQGGFIYQMRVTKPYLFHPKKHIVRCIASTYESNMIGEFPILGIKTGAGDGYYTLVAICEIPGVKGYVSAAIMQADSLENRLNAIEELLFAARKVITKGGARYCYFS